MSVAEPALTAPEPTMLPTPDAIAAMANRRVVMVINSDLYIRNYFQSGILAPLLASPNFKIIANQAIQLKDDLTHLPNFVGFYEYTDAEINRNTLFANIWMVRHRDRSTSFDFRCVRLWAKLAEKFSAASLAQTKTHSKLQKVFGWLPNTVRDPLTLNASRLLKLFGLKPLEWQTLAAHVLGKPGITEAFSTVFDALTQPNKGLRSYLKTLAPELVVFPFQAIDSPTIDIARLQDQLGYKSLYIVENWDNLSSKTVLQCRPHAMAVWGPQAKEHAETIQHYPGAQVYPIGTPRLQVYYDAMRESSPPEPIYPFKYVLFAGYSWTFDELTALHILDDTLDALLPSLPEPLKIVYRPHPWRLKRLCPDTFYEADFKHVVLDEQLKDVYYQPKQKGVLHQPALDYYPRLLLNCDVAVGCITSLMLELTICQKRCLILGYDDGVHLADAAAGLKYNKHYEHTEKLQNLVFVHEQAALAETFRQMVQTSDATVDWDAVERQIQYYHYADATPWIDRLARVMSATLGAA